MKERELSSKETRAKIEKLMSNVGTMFFATNGSHGHPNVRAMMPIRIDGTDTVWFATSLESSKLIELVKDSKAAVYGYSPNTMAEFRLWGNVAILDDYESRKRVWSDELKKYYPGGVDDPTMRILRFDVVSGLYAKDNKSGIFSN